MLGQGIRAGGDVVQLTALLSRCGALDHPLWFALVMLDPFVGLRRRWSGETTCSVIEMFAK
jgi:hypothetical protein